MLSNKTRTQVDAKCTHLLLRKQFPTIPGPGKRQASDTHFQPTNHENETRILLSLRLARTSSVVVCSLSDSSSRHLARVPIHIHQILGNHMSRKTTKTLILPSSELERERERSEKNYINKTPCLLQSLEG